jgi:hypothetical protein
MNARSQKHAVCGAMRALIRILKRRVLVPRAMTAKIALLFRSASVVSRDHAPIAAIRRRLRARIALI